MSEISGQDDAIRFTQRDQWNKRDQGNNNIAKKLDVMDLGENNLNNEAVILDTKRKRVEDMEFTTNQEGELYAVNSNVNGPKNGIEAGSVLQARLEK